MNILFGFIFLAIIGKIKCQQVLNEELVIATQQPGEKVDIRKAKIERRFLEDLSDDEWHVAHLRTAVFDGRRDCMSETFADRATRYRKMLKEDGARVEYVSADPLPLDLEDMAEESCKVKDDFSEFFNNVTLKVTSANFIDATTVAQNITSALNTTASMKMEHTTSKLDSSAANTTDSMKVEDTTPKLDPSAVNTTESMKVEDTTPKLDPSAVNTTESMKVEDTTPTLDFKATTVESKVKTKKNKLEEQPKNDTRRASEYMFSSVEYYDESTEFDPNMCPDAVEIVTLNIDQLRSYDLECEKTVEWRSLD